MAKSSKQINQEVLDYLDSLTPGNKEYELATLKGVDKYLLEAAKSFLDKAKDNIRKENLISSGNLESELTFNIESDGLNYTLSVGYDKNSSAAKYYDFVNKGVRGFKSGKPNSQYSFKNAYPSKKMVANISSWIAKHQIKDKYESNTNKSSFGKKRASLTKMASERKKGLAFSIARGIKRKGLRRTLFFDNARDFAFGQDFVNGLAKIYGKEVSLVIKSNYGNNNQ